jgi:hypothetical protein
VELPQKGQQVKQKKKEKKKKENRKKKGSNKYARSPFYHFPIDQFWCISQRVSTNEV